MLLRVVAGVVLLLTGAAAGAGAEPEKKGSEEDQTMWGMAAKVRRAWVVPWIQELFVDGTPGGATMDGAGIDFARRAGRTEVVFGFGYDRLDAQNGYYLEKGGDPLVAGKVDYVTFSNPHWYTAEITVISHAQLHKIFELRFGAGLGAGWVRGSVRKTDAICTGPSIQNDCTPDTMGMEVNSPADIPPVLPVVNALVGVQLRPVKWLHLHLDAGLHMVPYVSAGATLYLW